MGTSSKATGLALLLSQIPYRVEATNVLSHVRTCLTFFYIGFGFCEYP